MNLNKLELNKEYTWKQICELTDIPYKTGNTKVKQMKQFESLCRFTKEKTKFTIHEIYNKPKEIEDGRKNNGGSHNRKSKYENIITKKEMKGEYDGFYVYAHYMSEEVVYVGKGCRKRAIDGKRPYKMRDLTKVRILKRFEDDELSALIYEKEMIEYYQSIGQCKYNDISYHCGKTITEESEKIFIQKRYDKLNNKLNKLLRKEEFLIQKINKLNSQIEKLKNKLE